MSAAMLCGKCSHAMHWKVCAPDCACRNDVATMPPYDPDPLRPDTWMGLPVSPDERPSTPLTFAWIVLAGLLCIAGGLAMVWLWTR